MCGVYAKVHSWHWPKKISLHFGRDRASLHLYVIRTFLNRWGHFGRNSTTKSLCRIDLFNFCFVRRHISFLLFLYVEFSMLRTYFTLPIDLIRFSLTSSSPTFSTMILFMCALRYDASLVHVYAQYCVCIWRARPKKHAMTIWTLFRSVSAANYVMCIYGNDTRTSAILDQNNSIFHFWHSAGKRARLPFRFLSTSIIFNVHCASEFVFLLLVAASFIRWSQVVIAIANWRTIATIGVTTNPAHRVRFHFLSEARTPTEKAKCHNLFATFHHIFASRPLICHTIRKRLVQI